MSDRDKDQEELAIERTEFAEDRTVQATERTFAGWLRTSFGAIGVGLGFHYLFGEVDPTWFPKALASLFFILAASIALAAERRACHTFSRLKTHEIDRPRIPAIRWMSWSVAAAALLLVAGVWLLNPEGGGPA